MATFTCLITDQRTVPTLSFYLTTDEATARDLARQDLAANPHHEAFEVREGGRLLFVEERWSPPT
jgi:hypothetical protein